MQVLEVDTLCRDCERRRVEALVEGEGLRRDGRGRRKQRARRGRKGREGGVMALGQLETIEEARGPIIIRTPEDVTDYGQMTPEVAVGKMVEEERRKGWAILQRGERAAAARSVPVELAMSWFG